MVSTPHREVKTPAAGPAKGERSDDARFSRMQSSIDELRDLFLGSCSDNQEGSRSGGRKLLARHSGAEAAAITTEPSWSPEGREYRSGSETRTVQALAKKLRRKSCPHT